MEHPDTRPDRQLLAATPGDPDAFAVFYRRHVGAVIRFIARRAQPADVGDLVAEVFAAALVHRRRFDSERGSAAAWLTGIATNKLAEARRQRARGLDRGCPQARQPRTQHPAFPSPAGGSMNDDFIDDLRAGTLKIDYRSFCTATCNAFGRGLFDTQQVAAYAAGVQDRFWQYALIFYDMQGADGKRYVTARYLHRLATQTPGLTLATWASDRRDPALLKRVRGDGSIAIAAGVYGTPTVIVRGPRGKTQIRSALPSYRALKLAIRKVS